MVFPNAYSGNWNNAETSSVYGSSNYPVIIEAQDNNKIAFSFLYGFKTKVVANTVEDEFTISIQVIEGNSVSGSGSLVSANHIDLTYIVDNGLFKDTITASLSK